MNNIKYILVNDGAAEPRFNAALPRFKVQGSLTKVRATRGSMTRVNGPVQRSRFKVALPRGRVVVSGKGLLRSFVGSVSSIPKPKSWVYRNWVNIAYILQKE